MVKMAIWITISVILIAGLVLSIIGYVVQMKDVSNKFQEKIKYWIGNRGALFAIIEFLLLAALAFLGLALALHMPELVANTNLNIANISRKVQLVVAKVERLLDMAQHVTATVLK